MGAHILSHKFSYRLAVACAAEAAEEAIESLEATE